MGSGVEKLVSQARALAISAVMEAPCLLPVPFCADIVNVAGSQAGTKMQNIFAFKRLFLEHKAARQQPSHLDITPSRVKTHLKNHGKFQSQYSDRQCPCFLEIAILNTIHYMMDFHAHPLE